LLTGLARTRDWFAAESLAIAVQHDCHSQAIKNKKGADDVNPKEISDQQSQRQQKGQPNQGQLDPSRYHQIGIAQQGSNHSRSAEASGQAATRQHGRPEASG
jgi:hypothetical protein